MQTKNVNILETVVNQCPVLCGSQRNMGWNWFSSVLGLQQSTDDTETYAFLAVFTADELNWTELTCTKMTQLHDALLVTCVGVTKLIGWCRAAVRELQISSVQFVCCKHGFTSLFDEHTNTKRYRYAKFRGIIYDQEIEYLRKEQIRKVK